MGGEEVDEHKRTPAALPIMIGLTIMALLVVLYCVFSWNKHRKEKKALRYSNRGKGKQLELAEEP